MQYYFHARYPTDDWHLAYMFSLVYFPSKCVWKACFPIHMARFLCQGLCPLLPLIFITIYWVVCVQLAHFSFRWLKGCIYRSFYYHHQIGSIHLSHCYHIFPWLCAWDVCYIICCHLLHIRSGKTGNLVSLLLCSLWWVQIFGYFLVCRSYSFVCTVHHLISIIVQIYLKALNLWNVCQISFVECVSKIEHILSVIHYTICGAVCFQFTHFCCDDWENIYTLSYYHHQIGSMNYYPLFRVRSWNNGVRCMSFYILILSIKHLKCEIHAIVSLLPAYMSHYASTKLRAWIRIYIHMKEYGVITY